MEFKRGQFYINDHHSSEFNVYMSERPKRTSSNRVIELRERAGNDSIVLDYAYYQNVEWSISCYAKVMQLDSVSNQEDLITHWLDMGKYSDFAYFFDKEYIYQAIVTSPPDFTGTRKNGNLIPFTFNISLRPFKESVFGRRSVELTNGLQLFNSKKYHSKPKINIWGTGDISFYVNDKEYKLKNVPENIIVDTLIEEAYQHHDKQLIRLDDKTLFDDFPLLPPGWITFKWTGKVAKIEIIPRWCTKV
ncbi:MAG: phage tail protein [Enterococcus gilvus]